jgi:hypothetical protein
MDLILGIPLLGVNLGHRLRERLLLFMIIIRNNDIFALFYLVHSIIILAFYYI